MDKDKYVYHLYINYKVEALITKEVEITYDTDEPIITDADYKQFRACVQSKFPGTENFIIKSMSLIWCPTWNIK